MQMYSERDPVMLIGLLILSESTRNNIFTLQSLRILLQASP